MVYRDGLGRGGSGGLLTRAQVEKKKNDGVKSFPKTKYTKRNFCLGNTVLQAHSDCNAECENV